MGDSNVILLNDMPVAYVIKPKINLIENINQNNNLFDFRNEWISNAFTNEISSSLDWLYDEDLNFIGTNEENYQNPIFNLSLIRNRRVVYNQGREKIIDVTGFSQNFLNILPEYGEATTLHIKTYYFQDLENEVGDVDIDEIADELIARLSEEGNDMHTQILVFLNWIYFNGDSSPNKRWFISLFEYFNEEGERLNENFIIISGFSASEEMIKRQGNQIVGLNFMRPTGSTDIGESIEVHTEGIQYGIYDRGIIYPYIKVTSRASNVRPARRQEN